MRKRDVLLATAGLLVVWQLASMLINQPVLPPPWEVLRAFILSLPHDLGRHMLVSAWRVVASILVAVSFAVPLGLGLGLSPTLNRLAAPAIYLLYPMPKVVFLPVILLLLGIGNLSKIFMIALILFFQILVVVRDEAANLRPELIASVHSLGAGRRAIFRFVYLPACLPAVLTSLRVSIGTAIAVLFFAESFATTSKANRPALRTFVTSALSCLLVVTASYVPVSAGGPAGVSSEGRLDSGRRFIRERNSSSWNSARTASRS